MVIITDRPHMTSVVYCGFKATNQSINGAVMIQPVHTSEFEKHKICINSSLILQYL